MRLKKSDEIEVLWGRKVGERWWGKRTHNSNSMMLVMLHTIPYNLNNHLFTLCKQGLYSLKYSKHLSQVFENPSNKQMDILQTWCEETWFFLVSCYVHFSFPFIFSVWGRMGIALPSLASFHCNKKMSVLKSEATVLNTEKISPSQELGRGYRYLLLLSLINPVPEGDNLQTTYMTRDFRDKETWLPHREGSFTHWSAGIRCLW